MLTTVDCFGYTEMCGIVLPDYYLETEMGSEVLEQEFFSTCIAQGIKHRDITAIKAFLAPLRNKNEVTHIHYLHSLRVGLLSAKIAPFLYLNPVPLLMAGALHDLGKCQVCQSTLCKSEGWTEHDAREVEQHVMDGYRLLRGRFDLSAEIILWHHRFQADGYPRVMPPLLHEYKEATKLLIVEYGRIIALADVYDALHRVNDKFGEKKQLSGTEIRQKMLEYNPDKVALILELYKAKVFVL